MSDFQNILQSEASVEQPAKGPTGGVEGPQVAKEGDHTDEITPARMYDHFDIQDPGSVQRDTKDMLRVIGHFILSRYDNLDSGLRDVEGKIGQPPIGRSRIKHVYNYIKVIKSIRNSFKDKEIYEDKGGDNN